MMKFFAANGNDFKEKNNEVIKSIVKLNNCRDKPLEKYKVILNHKKNISKNIATTFITAATCFKKLLDKICLLMYTI